MKTFIDHHCTVSAVKSSFLSKRKQENQCQSVNIAHLLLVLKIIAGKGKKMCSPTRALERMRFNQYFHFCSETYPRALTPKNTICMAASSV